MIRTCNLHDGETFEWDDEDDSYRYRIRDATGRVIVTMSASHPTPTFNRWVTQRAELDRRIRRIEMAEVTASILPEPWATGKRD
jgi:hypothetical protein